MHGLITCPQFTILICFISKGNERQKFLSEIEMKNVAEGHVVRLLGWVTIQEPLMLIIIYFVKYGDLLSYLRTITREWYIIIIYIL